MEICQNPDILRVILYVSKILKIFFFLVPMCLIVMIGLDFFKNVTANKEDEMKKNLNIAIKRIIYCACIFFVPTIVGLVNNLLGELKIDKVSCLTELNIETIENIAINLANEAFAKVQNEQNMKNVREAENAISKIKDSTIKKTLQEELESIKEKILNETKENQEPEEPTVIPGSVGGSNGFENYGPGTEGNYFAPIQGITNYYLSGMSETGGCLNSVYHDLSGVAEGTPIYAGMDGTAVFFQTTSTAVVSGKNVLTSYGNQVKITASNGTYIIYAHLQKFPDGIKTPVTETCPKKGSSPPCSASVYASKSDEIHKQEVKKGDLIGYLGNTGNSTGPHLHVEIHDGGSNYCVSDPWLKFGMK